MRYVLASGSAASVTESPPATGGSDATASNAAADGAADPVEVHATRDKATANTTGQNADLLIIETAA
ncbi:MAG: hypothetical protein AB1Z67_12630 [Candidatus Limnocylindrales bacterium]